MTLKTLKSFNAVLIILLIVGFSVVGGYFLNIPGLSFVSSKVTSWSLIIAAAAYGLGVVSITLHHVKEVKKRSPGKWYLSAYLLVMMWMWIIVGVVFGSSHDTFQWFLNNMYQPVRVSASGLMTFFVFAGAYRAFRVKTVEATILMTVAILMMLRNVPIGSVLLPQAPAIANWLGNILGMSAQRGLSISIGVGTAMYALRILIGSERRPLGVLEEEL